MAQARLIERNSGVALWRQIADSIRLAIAGGEFDETAMMPGEIALAARYGVNRHTVRAAIAALVGEGLLEAVQGRGTMVKKRRRFTFPIRRRTRFNEGLAGQAQDRQIRCLGHGIAPAAPDVADALGLAVGTAMVKLDLLSSADGLPVALSTNWFDTARFGGIAEAFLETGSVTQALASLGIEDYVRQSTEITARLADPDERAALQLMPGSVVMITRAINATPSGQPIQYAQTAFVADRVALRMEPDAGS